ncbi:MAG: glutathione S-transferase [Rhodobacteraceae bacterium]|nr:glutathione S-transferase [Paracoccaceae bacterium]
MTVSTRPTITALERSPDGGQGMARDMRVRWALEEVGQPYDVRPVSFAAMKASAHRKILPFGQIPNFGVSDLALFESGAIMLHVATCHEGLLPADPRARACAIAWMFAPVGTVEPVVTDREAAENLECHAPWFATCLRAAEDRIRVRLTDLYGRLDDAHWLDGAFSAGDLMMPMCCASSADRISSQSTRTFRPRSSARRHVRPSTAPAFRITATTGNRGGTPDARA